MSHETQGAHEGSRGDTPGLLPSVQSYAAPSPAPIPPVRGKRATIAITAVVLLVAALCAFVVWGSTMLFGQFDDPALYEETMGVPEGAWITPDGRFAVLATYETDDTPMVVAIDLDTGEVREESGYLLVGAEEAPVLWLLPMAAEELQSRLDSDAVVPGTGPYDEPPAALEVWDLDETGNVPSDRAPARWRAIESSGEWIAYLEVDVLRGSHPARLLFNNAASSGEGHKAETPDDFGTFSFRGFSPSAEYVALEELTQTSEIEEAIEKGTLDSVLSAGAASDLPVRRLLIVRASDGSVVAKASLDGSVSDGGPVQWDARSDHVVWLEHVYDDKTGEVTEVRVRGLDPYGDEADMFDVWGIDPPEGWAEPASVTIAGVDREAGEVVLVADAAPGSRIWALGAGGAVDRGALPWGRGTPVYREGVGFIQLETEWNDDGSRSVAVRYDLHGGTREVLWRGPREATWD